MGWRKALYRTVLTALMVTAAYAAPASQVTEAALSGNFSALQSLQENAPTAGGRALATAAVAAMRNRDTTAIKQLSRLSVAGSPADVRAMADLLLSGIYMRLGAFGKSYAVMDAAQRLGALPFSDGMKQSLAIARALQNAPVMAVEKQASGFLGLLRGPLGLTWAKVWAGDRVAAAVMDSGTGFSVMTESEAKRVGLKLLPGQIQEASDAKAGVPCHLGVLDKLSFGKVVLRHVPFLVMPDAALRFKKNYTVPMVIGSSVFLQFDQIAFLHWSGKEWLYYGKNWQGAAVTPNMMLSGLQPYAVLPAEGFETPLRLFIDSGAAHSHLNAAALLGYTGPAAVSQAKLQWGSVGGVQSDPGGGRLPKLRLRVGGEPFDLTDLAVRSVAVSGRDGVLGQDLLRQGWGFALDFHHMHFALITEHSAPAVKDKIFRRFYVDIKLKEMQIRNAGGLLPNLPTTGFSDDGQRSQSHAISSGGH